MAYPRFQRARAHRFIRRGTGTNMALANNAGTYVDFGGVTNGPGAAGFDMTIEAQIGDVLEYTPNFLAGNEAVITTWDIATIVSAAVVNWFSSGTSTHPTSNGLIGWYASGSGQYFNITGPAWYTVQAGDIDANGRVTVRPYVLSTGVRTIYTDGSSGFLLLSVKNLGPADPE